MLSSVIHPSCTFTLYQLVSHILCMNMCVIVVMNIIFTLLSLLIPLTNRRSIVGCYECPVFQAYGGNNNYYSECLLQGVSAQWYHVEFCFFLCLITYLRYFKGCNVLFFWRVAFSHVIYLYIFMLCLLLTSFFPVL